MLRFKSRRIFVKERFAVNRKFTQEIKILVEEKIQQEQLIYALYTQRRDDYAGQTAYDMKNIRKELDETFRKIMQTIEALAILQPSEALNTLITKINAAITQWQNVLAVRSGKKGGKDSQPTESESKEEI